MEAVKIIVKPESSNLWWGIYGFCEKVGWEDLNLFYENGERITTVCLNAKHYLRTGLDELKTDPEEKEFAEAIEVYLNDNKCYFWYYYDDKEAEDLYEVPYLAPKNKEGVKPRFIDIWHPDEGIGRSTIESGVKSFALKHLEIVNCDIEIRGVEEFSDSLKSFEENQKLFGGDSQVRFELSDQLVKELSLLWKKPEAEVVAKLKDAIS